MDLMVNKGNWDNYSKHSIMMRGHTEFLAATKQITCCLNEVLQNSSEDNLKENIAAFLKEREDFLKYASANPPRP